MSSLVSQAGCFDFLCLGSMVLLVPKRYADYIKTVKGL
jgi:hypothetical protein